MPVSALVRRVAVGLCAPLSVLLFAAGADKRIPNEDRYKSGYINPIPKPPDFTSAMLWGIAIADTREPGFQDATIEIAHTQLTCRADGKDVILNDDSANVRGGFTAATPGLVRMFTIPCRLSTLIHPLLAKTARSGAP